MLLPTTIAGSLPKPAWLAPPNQLWAPWLLDGPLLEEGKRDAVRLAVDDQEQAGIDILTDGEQTRRHFVTTFIESLDGVDFEHRKTVRIRNRYDADVPVVTGPVARRRPVFAEDAAFLRSLTRRKIKFTLPGPMTAVDTLYDAHYGSREKLAWAFAEILNEEARAIEAAGVDAPLHGDALIAIDKLDKVGRDGVRPKAALRHFDSEAACRARDGAPSARRARLDSRHGRPVRVERLRAPRLAQRRLRGSGANVSVRPGADDDSR